MQLLKGCEITVVFIKVYLTIFFITTSAQNTTLQLAELVALCILIVQKKQSQALMSWCSLNQINN